jgi:uncharacterized protein (TIGR00255 family)
MTGYGRGESLAEQRNIITEVRSVNHRFLDISVRMPRIFSSMEINVRREVSASTLRGKVDVTIQYEDAQGISSDLHLNIDAAKSIFNMLQEIKKEVSMPDDVTLSTLVAFKDFFFEKKEAPADEDLTWKAIKEALQQALTSMVQMQKAEGEEISKDIKNRLHTISETLEEIEARVPESLELRRSSLVERIQALCQDVEIDPERLAQEIAIMADKSDITEEIVRAKSHIKQFTGLFITNESIGRKLEFLLQEMNRETNTMGSKASDSEISVKVIDIKNELEKIREQVQNIM